MQSVSYAEAIAAANVILRDGYGIAVRKGLNPLNQRDYLVIERRLARSLNTAGIDEERALRKAVEQLDVDWGNLSEAGRERVLDAATRTVGGSAAKVLPRTRGVLTVEGERIVGETRKATKRRYRLDIETTTTDFDRRIGSHIVSSQGNFTTNELGLRTDLFSTQARGIVGVGLERGEGRVDIAARMEKQALRDGIARKRSYWEVAAGSFANRGRTFAQFSSYNDAGIERYLFDSVLDEATTDICRFLHAKTFTVASGVAKFNEVDNLTEPGDIKNTTPWVRTREVDGQLQLQYKSGGQTFSVGRVIESAVGTADQTGRFGNALSPAQLAERGISYPPMHGLCRSTVVPDI